MNILFIDNNLPMPDRASADLRMFTIVKLLAEQGHHCHYFILDASAFRDKYSQSEFSRYQTALEKPGITVHVQNLNKVLLGFQFDVIYFKYFYPAENRLNQIKLLQPCAKIIIDSVDLIYARLFAKAELENSSLFFDEAIQAKERELATYAKADLTITITAEDTSILLDDNPSINTFIIPNIHEIYDDESTKTDFPSLIFIGIFSHEPNVDAVLYFYNKIWPELISKHPNIRWFIVGGNPPPEIQQLNGKNIEVTGYVPETLPYLKKSWISIAPLRFGAGMKGKVGEAMAAGIPVVTTDFGAQGLAVSSDKELIVCSSESDYSTQISSLISDSTKRSRIGNNGLKFIELNYSPSKVSGLLINFITMINKLPKRPVPLYSRPYRYWKRLELLANKHLFWRFRK